jgi:Uma2 family endonuclease
MPCPLNLITWLGIYHVFTAGTQGGDNSTLRLQLGANMPQPDAYLRILAEYGGHARVASDGYVLGAPDLIAEVAASSASYDLHEKLQAYQQNGVRDYLVWRAQDRAIDWFVLRGGRFRQLPTAADGLLKSKILPGLWLDGQALISGGMLRVYEIGQMGLASHEHRRFVEKLRKRKRD